MPHLTTTLPGGWVCKRATCAQSRVNAPRPIRLNLLHHTATLSRNQVDGIARGRHGRNDPVPTPLPHYTYEVGHVPLHAVDMPSAGGGVHYMPVVGVGMGGCAELPMHQSNHHMLAGGGGMGGWGVAGSGWSTGQVLVHEPFGVGVKDVNDGADEQPLGYYPQEHTPYQVEILKCQPYVDSYTVHIVAG